MCAARAVSLLGALLQRSDRLRSSEVCYGITLAKKGEMVVDGTINFDMCQGQLVPRAAFIGIPFISFRFYEKFVIVLFNLRKGKHRKRGLVGCTTTKQGIIQRALSRYSRRWSCVCATGFDTTALHSLLLYPGRYTPFRHTTYIVRL